MSACDSGTLPSLRYFRTMKGTVMMSATKGNSTTAVVIEIENFVTRVLSSFRYLIGFSKAWARFGEFCVKHDELADWVKFPTKLWLSR